MYKDFEKIRERMSHIEDKMMFMFSTFEKIEDEKEIFKTVEELTVLMSAIYVDKRNNIDMIDNVSLDELAISFSHIINYLYPEKMIEHMSLKLFFLPKFCTTFIKMVSLTLWML